MNGENKQSTYEWLTDWLVKDRKFKAKMCLEMIEKKSEAESPVDYWAESSGAEVVHLIFHRPISQSKFCNSLCTCFEEGIF